MKNFIDLMVEMSKNEELTKECMSKLHEGDHSELSAWFKEKGYEVHADECKKLTENKNDIKNSSAVGIFY